MSRDQRPARTVLRVAASAGVKHDLIPHPPTPKATKPAASKPRRTPWGIIGFALSAAVGGALVVAVAQNLIPMVRVTYPAAEAAP